MPPRTRPCLVGLLLVGGCGVADVGPLGSGLLDPYDSGVADWDLGSVVDLGVRDAGRRDRGVPEVGVVDASPMPNDIEATLRSIPGLRVEEITTPLTGVRAFELWLRQPEDHGDPIGLTFEQRLVLIHRSVTGPMVLHTTGYGMFNDPSQFGSYELEPTVALQANQITVEHRFFGESIRPSARWQFLTVEQSARDSHRIKTVLGAIYRGPWIGSGVSKGGMTAIFHHHFFPQDLVGIVPYVAPISFGFDTRYQAFLDQIGPPDGACRERELDIEHEAVERRAELAEYHRQADVRAQMYSDDNLEALTVFPVVGFRWNFWQYYASRDICDFMPPRGSPIDSLAAFFPFQPEAYFNQGVYEPELTPYYYQVNAELGIPDVDVQSYLEPELSDVPFDSLPPATIDPRPWGADPILDPTTMHAVDTNLRTRAAHILGIYGAWDPWSGGRITVDEDFDNLILTAPELNHGAQILYLVPSDQDVALATLYRWAGRSAFAPPSFDAVKAKLASSPGHRRIVELTMTLEQRARFGRPSQGNHP